VCAGRKTEITTENEPAAFASVVIRIAAGLRLRSSQKPTAWPALQQATALAPDLDENLPVFSLRVSADILIGQSGSAEQASMVFSPGRLGLPWWSDLPTADL
jgi:hypothetical protein